MTFNPQTGITGSVKIGATPYAFGKWSLSMKTNAMPTNNFTNYNAGTGVASQTVIGGVTSAELTLESLTYDQGNMPFTCGTTYSFVLGYNATTSITVPIFVESIEPSVDFDGLQPMRITGKSNGAFVPSIT